MSFGPRTGWSSLACQKQACPSTPIVNSLLQNPLIQGLEKNVTVVLPEFANGKPKRSIPDLKGGAPNLFLPGAPWTPYLNQPANGIIRLADAQRAFGQGSGAISVAVIDTGVDHTHPVLLPAVNFWQGWDFTTNKPGGSGNSDLNQETTPFVDQETTPFVDGTGSIIVNQETTPFVDQETTPFVDTKLPPAFGHGTMVAGIVHLVAPNARIIPIKAFSSDGSGSIADVIAAIYYATDQGASVINMSFSSPETSSELQRAISYAHSRGVVCVASVGNSGSGMNVYPATSLTSSRWPPPAIRTRAVPSPILAAM